MTGPIYEPKGKAKEYADYALNIYKGCPHGCPTCFAPLVLRKDRRKFHKDTGPRNNIVEDTRKQLAEWRQQGIKDRLIELCFTCDPFPYGQDLTPTFEIIEAIHESGNHVKLLTKNYSVQSDSKLKEFFRLASMLGEGDWFGCSFDGTRGIYEDVLACRRELVTVMRYMHERTNTWVSFEPVIVEDEVLSMMSALARNGTVDEFKIGKLNYFKSDIDWKEFGQKAEEVCTTYNQNYYIKESLRKEMEQ